MSDLPTLLDFQQRATNQLVPLVVQGKGALLIGATGTGKTYTIGETIRQLLSSPEFLVRFTESRSPFPIIVVTKATVVHQTREVLFGEFKLPPDKIFVTNYDQFRATIGSIWISWHKKQIKDDINDPSAFVEIPLAYAAVAPSVTPAR